MQTLSLNQLLQLGTPDVLKRLHYAKDVLEQLVLKRQERQKIN